MSATGWIQTILAIAALLTGAGNLLRPKGTTVHRWLGRGFAVSMAGLNLSALTIYRLTSHFDTFHVLALLSLATLAAGVVPVLLHRPRGYWLGLHYFAIGLAYAGLCAALFNELLARVPFLHTIVVPRGFEAALLARIFRVSSVLSNTVTLLAVGLLAWRYRSVMAGLGRQAKIATRTPVVSAATLTSLGQVLLLLGCLTFVRDAGMQFLPGVARVLAVWLNAAALAATLLLAYRRRGEAADLRWVGAYYFLLLFATVWSGMLGRFGARDLLAFYPTVLLCGVVMLGVYLADALVVLGVAATGLIVVGYRFSGPWFPLWVAIIGGGAEAWAGWRLLALRRHAVPASAAIMPAAVL